MGEFVSSHPSGIPLSFIHPAASVCPEKGLTQNCARSWYPSVHQRSNVSVVLQVRSAHPLNPLTACRKAWHTAFRDTIKLSLILLFFINSSHETSVKLKRLSYLHFWHCLSCCDTEPVTWCDVNNFWFISLLLPHLEFKHHLLTTSISTSKTLQEELLIHLQRFPVTLIMQNDSFPTVIQGGAMCRHPWWGGAMVMGDVDITPPGLTVV